MYKTVTDKETAKDAPQTSSLWRPSPSTAAHLTKERHHVPLRAARVMRFALLFFRRRIFCSVMIRVGRSIGSASTGGTQDALCSSSCSLRIHASLFCNALRCSWQLTTMVAPSEVRLAPLSLRRSAVSSSSSKNSDSISRSARNSTLLLLLFVPCPPGPLPRMVRISYVQGSITMCLGLSRR